MDDVSCVGTETDIKECPHSHAVNCNENEGAGAVCEGSLTLFVVR